MKPFDRIREKVFLIFILVFPGIEVSAQIYINEFLASNTSVNVNPADNNNDDWIELYNAGNNTVDLKDYYLTDNLKNPTKWQITTNLSISAHGYLLIWADGSGIGARASFKLAQEGEEIGLFDPNVTLVDSVSFVNELTDISHGRRTDGAAQWGYFSTPTPGSANNTRAYNGMVDNVPEFSLPGGLFDHAVQVNISTDLGGTIRYTTDGSEPLESSPVASGTIPVDTTTIIRARVFKPNMIPGRIVTQSYFINENFEARKLPVVSLATNPENFWDPVKGIYVQKFKPDWEVPVNIELFENDGSDRAAFNLQAGTKVNGLWSWQLPQKMLGIYFHKRYGESNLSYHLLFEKNRVSFKNFALRASGSDWSYTLFRDGLMHQALLYNMDIDMMGFRPAIVYVNGEYMGIANIREKVDDDYIEKNHNMPAGSFDLVENENFAESGSLTAYYNFKSTYYKDLSVQSSYNAVDAIMNIHNFTDYVITEIYDGNTSVDHNVMAWKPKDYGKWKWVLMDLDRGFFNPDENMISFYSSRSEWPLGHLLMNAGYVKFFGQKLADHLYTTYNSMRMIKLIEQHKRTIEAEIPNHVVRWLGTTSSYGDAMPSVDYWYQQVEALKSFAEERPVALLNDLAVNYGFSSPASLILTVYPAEGGSLTLNGLKVPEAVWSGLYPKDLSFTLKAVDKPGYDFKGWQHPQQTILVSSGSNWKYLDDGSNQDTAWRQVSFDDGTWRSGPAQLGYGDGDEATVVSYGSDANNKYITTYFRHSFEVQNNSLTSCLLNLVRDDGAIVYLNGKEIVRTNMPEGNADYQTPAVTSVGGTDESAKYTFNIDPGLIKTGTNVLAVEIHQSAGNSSDLSFDLELLGYTAGGNSFITTSREYTTKLNGDLSLAAVYESNGACLIPDTVKTDMTLEKACSPWLAQGNVVIPEGVTLTVEPGVEVRMPAGASIFIHGKMVAKGTAGDPVYFRINPDDAGERWGILSFENSPDTSKLSWVTIEDASFGPVPTREVAAISAFHATLVLDHMTIDKVYGNPITGRYSDITLTNSYLHSEITGDLINVKYGKAHIENCEFNGNKFPDTDGIDFDDVENGIIRGCKIYGLSGYNSDGIDIGEKATNIMIDSNLIFNIYDKGVSVGQRSTVKVSNTTFVNCNLGLGLKDSSDTYVDHCTFYSVGTPVDCFEKIVGRAGGNAIVHNSILSNSVNASYLVDHRSTLRIDHSLSDNDSLPAGSGNIFGNPLFENPTFFDFNLNPTSPCRDAGMDGKAPADMGSLFHRYGSTPNLMFSGIFANNDNEPDKSEFLIIYNPSDATIDLANYKISNGIDFTFPVDGSQIGPNESIFIVKDANNPPVTHYSGKVFQWNDGSLANEGETIALQDSDGIVLDRLHYRRKAPWPEPVAGKAEVLSLISPELDNHFAESWAMKVYGDFVSFIHDSTAEPLSIYPNPATSRFYIETTKYPGAIIKIYDLQGKLIYTRQIDETGYAAIDVGGYASGMYLLRIGDETKKLIILPGR